MYCKLILIRPHTNSQLEVELDVSPQYAQCQELFVEMTENYTSDFYSGWQLSEALYQVNK